MNWMCLLPSGTRSGLTQNLWLAQQKGCYYPLRNEETVALKCKWHTEVPTQGSLLFPLHSWGLFQPLPTFTDAHPGIKSRSPILADSLPTEPPGKLLHKVLLNFICLSHLSTSLNGLNGCSTWIIVSFAPDLEFRSTRTTHTAWHPAHPTMGPPTTSWAQNTQAKKKHTVNLGTLLPLLHDGHSDLAVAAAQMLLKSSIKKRVEVNLNV